MSGEHTPIYLDHNATTPLLSEVVEAMLPYLQDHFGNPSSGHVYGRRSRDAVEHARSQVADLIGCSSGEIIFTSGGTEANNLAIRGVTAALPDRKHVITSVVEHPATANPCNNLEQHAWEVTWVPVDKTGRVSPDQVASSLQGDTALITIMHAQNEVGTIQPIKQIAEMVHSQGVLLHTDAAQSVGKLPVDVEHLGVDLLSIAGHKLYGPKGVGALYVRTGTPLRPLLLGAGHERGLRPGTENVASIVGLGQACKVTGRGLSKEMERITALRELLWENLRLQIPEIKLNGHPDQRLPNTLNVRFPGVSGGAVLAEAPEVAASTGSACHQGGESASPVLTAMGLDVDMALGSVRLSLGRATTEEDIVVAVEQLVLAWKSASEVI